jgi:flagellar motor protein MotB
VAGKHGGGSWKVAYADFVTAMMAFFLVMWIGAQDQKTRQSVANYFIDPSGVSKKPAKTGAVFDSVTYGNLPDNEKAAMARGRDSYSSPGEPSPVTKMVSDWVHADAENQARWREHARACRDAAAQNPDVLAKTATLEVVAARELSKRLREALAADAVNVKGIQQDLILWSLGEVNWTQIAEDLLAK